MNQQIRYKNDMLPSSERSSFGGKSIREEHSRADAKFQTKSKSQYAILFRSVLILKRSYRLLLVLLVFMIIFFFSFRAVNHEIEPHERFGILSTNKEQGKIEAFFPSKRISPHFLKKNRKLRILFLTHRYEYVSFMDRSFYFQYEAAMRHPYVEATLWGPGLPGYNANKTISENIIAKHGSIYYDIVFLFGQCKNAELKAISDQVIVTIREFECYDGRCGDYIEWNNASIFQLAYMTDMSHYEQQSSRRVIKHSPHGADPRIFYESPKTHRKTEVLLAGSTAGLYPLRRRWKKLIDEGVIRGTVFQHSGYFPIAFSEIKVDQDWSEKEEGFLQDRRIQVEKYADAMKQSLICVMDSSIYRYPLMKYVEATMAGCLIIADIPYDNPDMFRQFVVEVHEDDSDETLKQKVEYYLTHPEERIARVSRGQNLIRSFTWDVSIDRLIEAANDFKKGHYGIYASGQFIRGCAYKNPTEKNQWCS